LKRFVGVKSLESDEHEHSAAW